MLCQDIKKKNMDTIKRLAAELARLCNRMGVTYAVFFSERPHSITGGATFTAEELAILFETFSRKMPLDQVKFLRAVMDTIIQERSSWN